MGTSQSSTGPGPGVQLVPPWADPLPDVDDAAPYVDSEPPAPSDVDSGPDLVPLSPPRRFAGTRSHLGAFARTGDAVRMRRGVADYVRTGYGGASVMARRLGSVSSTARSLGLALDPSSTESGLDRTLLRGKAAEEIIDAVVEAARPQDGTLDAEASRESIREALSDLLGKYKDADLLDLNDAQREFVIEQFASHEVYRRFVLDVGKHLVDCAPDSSTGLARLKQVRSYIRQTVAEAFRKLRDAGNAMTSNSVRTTVSQALANSLTVFEGYTS